ncbi:hypothetical protein ZZ1p0124 [Acinetobacter phage ZZ1]|uniref:Uncharacterized protein n=1 Tax=Acinetobacter phage ZZ1 TaxID=1049283 RepID=I3WVE4_9CAUD|nr:hypothetical protein ZZ1p0124 [Acinetobacter phage ZZ1]AFL47464.1 hypothetical protein ZZ1p0124 [Acinetobacter phage ZZ1]
MLHIRKELENKLTTIIKDVITQLNGPIKRDAKSYTPLSHTVKSQYIVYLTNAITRFGEPSAPIAPEIERLIRSVINLERDIHLNNVNVIAKRIIRSRWFADKVVRARLNAFAKNVTPLAKQKSIILNGLAHTHWWSTDANSSDILNDLFLENMPRLVPMEARWSRANSRDVEGAHYISKSSSGRCIRASYDMKIYIEKQLSGVRLRFVYSCDSNRSAFRSHDYRTVQHRSTEYQRRWLIFLNMCPNLSATAVGENYLDVIFKSSSKVNDMIVSNVTIPPLGTGIDIFKNPYDRISPNIVQPLVQPSAGRITTSTIEARSPLDLLKSLDDQLEERIKDMKSKHDSLMRSHKDYVEKAKEANSRATLLLGDIQALESALSILRRPNSK